MSAYPWFAAQIPDGVYNLQVDYGGGGGTDITVTLDNHYYLPSATHARSVWTVLLTALQTVHASFAVGFALSTSDGYTATISAGSAFILDYTNTLTTNAGKLDLRWLGLPNADSASGTSLASSQPPSYCWSPRVPIDDRGWTPVKYRAFSMMTESGRSITVDHEPRSPYTVRKQWRHIILDSTRGVAAGRLQARRLIDTKTDWATPAGLAVADVFAALDAPGGWYRATLGGRPWIMLPDMTGAGVAGSFDDDYLQGPYEFVHADDGPCSMEGWATLGPPNVTKQSPGAGHRTIEFCAVESTDETVGELTVSV